MKRISLILLCAIIAIGFAPRAQAYTIILGNSSFTPLGNGKTKIKCTSSERACGIVWIGEDGKNHGLFDGSDEEWVWKIETPPPPPGEEEVELQEMIDDISTTGAELSNVGPAPSVPGWPVAE